MQWMLKGLPYKVLQYLFNIRPNVVIKEHSFSMSISLSHILQLCRTLCGLCYFFNLFLVHNAIYDLFWMKVRLDSWHGRISTHSFIIYGPFPISRKNSLQNGLFLIANCPIAFEMVRNNLKAPFFVVKGAHKAFWLFIFQEILLNDGDRLHFVIRSINILL